MGFWGVYDIPPSLVKKFIEKSHQKLDQIANLNKKKFLKANKRTKLTLSTEVLHGVSPALAIRYYANKNKIDFIMMNTHGRKGIKRIVLGSEAEKVIREALCPVLVFRP